MKGSFLNNLTSTKQQKTSNLKIPMMFVDIRDIDKINSNKSTTLPLYFLCIFSITVSFYCFFFPNLVQTTCFPDAEPDIYGVLSWKFVGALSWLCLIWLCLYSFKNFFFVSCFGMFVEIVMFDVFGWNILEHCHKLDLFILFQEFNLFFMFKQIFTYFLAAFSGIYTLLFAMTYGILRDSTMDMFISIVLLPLMTVIFLKMMWNILFFKIWSLFIKLLIAWVTFSLFIHNLEMVLAWCNLAGMFLKEVVLSSNLFKGILGYLDSSLDSSTYIGKLKMNFSNFHPTVWTRIAWYLFFGLLHMSFYDTLKNILLDSGSYKPFFEWVTDKWMMDDCLVQKKPCLRKVYLNSRSSIMRKKNYMQRKSKFFF